MKSGSAQDWIRHLGLAAHPEGGYYRRNYLCAERVDAGALPVRFVAPRAFSSSIYFLLDGCAVSHLHRIKSDELWHFYCGSSLEIYCISAAGELEMKKLGLDVESGEVPQHVVTAGTWFGAKLLNPTAFGLFGCTVSPAFDFEDFELAPRNMLLDSFPKHQHIIKTLT